MNKKINLFLLLLCLTLVTTALSQAALSQSSRITGSSGFFVESGQGMFESFGASRQVWVNDLGMTILFQGQDSVAVPVRFVFEGAGAAPKPVDRQPGVFHRYRGADPSNWQESLPVWAAVRFSGALITFRDGLPHLQANGDGLTLRVEGSGLKVEDGSLQIATPFGDFVPFVLTGDFSIRVVGHNEKGTPLGATLAPQQNPGPEIRGGSTGDLAYSTFFGGSLLDEGEVIELDSEGGMYVGGHTQSNDFPPDPGALSTNIHNVDAYVTKFAPDGSLAYVTLIQGGDLDFGEEYVTGLAVNGMGEAFVSGRTISDDFPTTPGAYDTTFNGGDDAFVMRLNADGTVNYSTLLGGVDTDWGEAIAIDATGRAYVTGMTTSLEFPTTGDAFDQTNNARDAYLTIFNADGSAIEFSSYYGGDSSDHGTGIALVGTAVYITGWTFSQNFPTTLTAFDPDFNGGVDAFVLKLIPGTPTLEYGTFIGGGSLGGEDRSWTVKTDSEGQALIGGQTNSGDFPTTSGVFDETHNGGTCEFADCFDGFVTKLTVDGSSLVFSTFIGGNGDGSLDIVFDLALDSADNLYLTGETWSDNFPLSPSPMDDTLGGDRDGFYAKLSSDAVSLEYSTYLGGADWDNGNGIALRADGDLVYLTGKTRSTDFPISADAHQPLNAGDYDIFVTALDFSPPPPPTPTPAAEMFLPAMK